MHYRKKLCRCSKYITSFEIYCLNIMSIGNDSSTVIGCKGDIGLRPWSKEVSYRTTRNLGLTKHQRPIILSACCSANYWGALIVTATRLAARQRIIRHVYYKPSILRHRVSIKRSEEIWKWRHRVGSSYSKSERCPGNLGVFVQLGPRIFKTVMKLPQ